MNMEEPSVKQCCATFYGSDFARILLGESFHPGGTQLTERLGSLLNLGPASHVLDVAAGRGTSAFCLAEKFGCKVTGIDLSEENVRLANQQAEQRALSRSVSFQYADAEMLPFADSTFDAVICECAFCTFPNKPRAAQQFLRILTPGGQLGLSDLTRSEKTIPELEGLLSWIACIGDALPVEQYASILQQVGFEIETVEDQSGCLLEMVQQVRGKLLGAEIAVGLKKLELPGIDFSTAKQFAQVALRATREGKLGYVVISAQKPGSIQ
ncbi:MAG: methyltransferase domain-containing protein [Acidobacteriota bacterium]|nr:methyltransferase domain-containing protein [Acidobacteriota bacterium]